LVGRYAAWRALERFREYLLSIGNEPVGEEFIFCNLNEMVIQDLREIFSAVIKYTGSEKDRIGEKYVPYSCRQIYITFRLKFIETCPSIVLQKRYGEVKDDTDKQ
jgi:hypothetical protein